MAASHEVFGARHTGVITAHHIAHCIDIDFVKTCLLHGVLNALRASQMGLSEIGHSELTRFFETGVAVLRQVFLPIPNLLALKRVAVGFVVQANLNNSMNISQTLLQFKIGVTVQASFKSGHDLMLVQAKSARSSDGQDKRPSKLLIVGSVEALDFFKFSGGAFSEARFALLVGRFCGQFFAHHGFACQFGVSTNKFDLSISACIFQNLRHAVFQVSPRSKRAVLERAFGNPRRVFIQAIKPLHGFL